MAYEGQGQTNEERIMGKDKKFVMVTKNAGLGMQR